MDRGFTRGLAIFGAIVMAFLLVLLPTLGFSLGEKIFSYLLYTFFILLIKDVMNGKVWDAAHADEILKNLGPKRDPQEDDPKLKPIIMEAADEAKRKLYRRFSLDEREHITWVVPETWSLQKSLLKKKGIKWKTPIEMNPVVISG